MVNYIIIVLSTIMLVIFVRGVHRHWSRLDPKHGQVISWLRHSK